MNVTAAAHSEPNFSNITAERLSHYKIIWQQCTDTLNKKLRSDVLEFDRLSNIAWEKWQSDPNHLNPTYPFPPFTIQNVHAFYESCDRIVDTKPSSIAECVFTQFILCNAGSHLS